MELEQVKLQTTWNDAAGSINSNYAKIADAIAQLKANGGGGGGGISELTSKMVVDALGYTPYNANNPANYITSAALTPYLKTEDAGKTYATKDFVNNKLINYATIVSVTAIQNTLTGQIGAVGASVEQLAATKLDSSYFTQTNIKNTLGISDWALAAIKPSYAWSEITSRPTALSQFTDDVVAGKYLPLSGGTIVGEFAIKAGAGNSATIRFSPNNAAINHWLGVNSAGVLWFSNNGWSQQYDILHSGNIGNYKSGDSDKLGGYGLTRFLLMTGRDYTEMDLNTIGGSQSIFTEIRTAEVTTTNSPYEGYGTLLSLKDRSGIAKMQFLGSYDSSVLYFRSQQKVEASITSAWKTIAFTDSNVASATKLATAHTLWGQSFDGTKDITLGLNLDGYKSTGTVSQISDLGDKGLVVGIDDKRNNYGMAFWVEGNCKGYIQQQAFGSSTTYSLCIQPFGGNVGIGTTSPTERLDVSGNIKADGNINATSITINGVTITASNGSITVNGNVFATGDITGFV